MIESARTEGDVKSSEIEHIPLPVGHAIDCISPETIARLGLPLLRTIAKLKSPKVIYPLIQYLANDDPLLMEECLGTEVALADVAFWDLATRMHFIQENGGVETLQADGHQFQKGEDRSTFLARILLEKRFELSKIISGLLDRGGVEFVGKTFHIFHGRLSGSVIIDRMTKLTVEHVRLALIEGFERKGYGNFCQVIPAGKGHETGFLVNRGNRRITNAVLDREETRKYRDDRKLKTDAIFVVPETGTLWIHCNGKADAQTYASIMSVLIGDPQAFGRRKSFHLDAFLSKNVGIDMLRVAQEMQFVRAEIRMVDIQLANGGTFKLSAKRGEPCLTGIFHEIEAIHHANLMQMIKIRLVMSPDGKRYADVEVKTGSLKVGHGLEPHIASQFLIRLGVWKPYVNC